MREKILMALSMYTMHTNTLVSFCDEMKLFNV